MLYLFYIFTCTKPPNSLFYKVFRIYKTLHFIKSVFHKRYSLNSPKKQNIIKIKVCYILTKQLRINIIRVIIFSYVSKGNKQVAIFKKKKYLIILFLLIIFLASFGLFLYSDKKNNAQIERETLQNLRENADESIYEPYKKLIPHFIIYEAFVNHKPLDFIRLGFDFGSQYYVPYYALEKSDAVIGYGIWYDISFEDYFSQKYEKPSYAFDCGIDDYPYKGTHPLCHFDSECIGTDKCVLPWLKSTKKVHKFSEKLKQLNLEKKPIYIRFDTGAEGVPNIFDDILANSEYITGMDIVIHCDDREKTILIEKLLAQIEKDFIPVARHTHHCHGTKFRMPNTKHYFALGMSLSYVNRKLVDNYRIKLNQDTDNFEYDGSLCYQIRSDILLYKYIPYVVKTTVKDLVTKTKQRFQKNNFTKSSN